MIRQPEPHRPARQSDSTRPSDPQTDDLSHERADTQSGRDQIRMAHEHRRDSEAEQGGRGRVGDAMQSQGRNLPQLFNEHERGIGPSDPKQSGRTAGHTQSDESPSSRRPFEHPHSRPKKGQERGTPTQPSRIDQQYRKVGIARPRHPASDQSQAKHREKVSPKESRVEARGGE